MYRHGQGGGGSPEQVKSHGFTMAEILLSLTIIGVVAAITLPSLTGNINERTWNTQRKALYARFSQAIALMPALNGYGSTAENAAETFITAGLSKVLKINNICGNDKLPDCGLPAKILTLNANSSIELESIKTLSEFNSAFDFVDDYGGSYHAQLITHAAAFETANGESILTYYVPDCRSDDSSSFVGKQAQSFMCANFVYDLNGTKGPNTVGKDVGFISVLYPSDSVVVAPVPVVGSVLSGIAFSDVASVCRNNDPETRVPNYEELASMFYNKTLLGYGDTTGTDVWSSKRVEGQAANAGWLLKFRTGTYVGWTQPANAKCIKR